MEKLFVETGKYPNKIVKEIVLTEENECNGHGFGETIVRIDYDRFCQLLQTIDTLSKRVAELERLQK